MTTRFLAILLLMACTPAFAEWNYSDMVTTESGKVRYHAKSIPDELVNKWPEALENKFQRRSHHIITTQRDKVKARANTYFENEKRTYGYLMAHVLGGDLKNALEYLQARDHQHEQWHKETDGIDYYACFTIKHQMRKYFYFGDLLDPDYRQQMYDGAQKWTKTDPLRKPHYAFANKQGWGPDARNSWVDIRSTENLYLMRVTSVYLMAEETKNHETTQIYRNHIFNYTKTLFRIGIGEWDSENYHGHSIAPLLNLYDFAKDIEVKKAAKACLDFYSAAGALKYWRGGFNGPTKRDYNHAQPFGGSAANSLWVWFGEHPQGKGDHWESDEVHQITSAYRPPLAVVNLAQKKFTKPIEIIASKPGYSATTKHQYDSRPEYVETQYIANTYQMGSLTSGTDVDGGDTNGFKILAYDEVDGAIALHAAPSYNPAYPGSPMYKKGIIKAENRVAQNKNLAIWLAQDGQAPWVWVLPKKIQVSIEQGITFLECDKTWIALHPIGLEPIKDMGSLSQFVSEKESQRFPNHKLLKSVGKGGSFCGFAIEIGEKESHSTFQNFKRQAIQAKLDKNDLESGHITFKASRGNSLAIQWNDNPVALGIWKDGKQFNPQDAMNHLYKSSIINSEWGRGILELKVGSESYRCKVNDKGQAEFQ